MKLGLDQVNQKAHPILTYQEIQDYLKNNCSTCSFDDYILEIDDFYIAEENGTVYLLMTMYVDNDIKLLSALINDYDNSKANIENWMSDIYKVVKAQYPDKTVCGGLYYRGTSTIYPTSYPVKDVTYSSTLGIWVMNHMEIDIYESGGNYIISWSKD